MAENTFQSFSANLSSPAEHAENIGDFQTGETQLDLDYVTRAIYVGGAGDLGVITLSGDEVLFVDVPAGTIIPIRATAITDATDATYLVAMW